MTATDELRRMLDERGVEWHGDIATYWRDADAVESLFADNALDVSLYAISPEQAIEATLGRGTCHDVGKGWMWRCSECKCRLDIDRDYLPTMWVDGMADVPRFCPNCGRRVVE